MNADGSNQVDLTKDPAVIEEGPAWSPDGTRIAFARAADIHVMHADGYGITNITKTIDSHEVDPSWQPLGSTLCAAAVSPTSQSFEAKGGIGSVDVRAGSECTWTASSPVGWITVTSGSRSGNASVAYSVGANTSTSSRTAGLTVAGRIVIITQRGIPVRITGVSVEGKRLLGENFDAGAVILLNGVEQKTRNDPQNPQAALVGKKAGRKIAVGDILQIRNPNGSLSQEFVFAS